MKKTYSAPTVHAIEFDTTEVCINVFSTPANTDPAGARYREGRRMTDELLFNEEFYDDSFYDE